MKIKLANSIGEKNLLESLYSSLLMFPKDQLNTYQFILKGMFRFWEVIFNWKNRSYLWDLISFEWNSSSGVLAVVNANSDDGEIVWRRTMPKNEGKPKYLFSARNGPITVTEAGIVRFWDNTSGREGSLIKEAFPNERDYKLEQCIRLYSKYQVICSYQNVEDGSSFLQIYTESSSEEGFFTLFLFL